MRSPAESVPSDQTPTPGNDSANRHGSTTQPTGGPPVSYQSDKGKFTTQYPADWKPTSGSDTLDLAPRDSSQGDDSVDVDVPHIPFHLPGTVTVGAAQGGLVDDFKKKYQDFKVTSETSQSFPDANAKGIKGTGKKDGKDYVIEAIIAVRHDRVFIICTETQGNGASAGHAAVEQILSSWKWQ